MEYSEDVVRAAKRLNIHPEAVQTYLDAGKGKRAAGVERSMHVTIKPVGAFLYEQRGVRQERGARARRPRLLVRSLRLPGVRDWKNWRAPAPRDGLLAPAARVRARQAQLAPRGVPPLPVSEAVLGECPRTRIVRTREGEGNLGYLCGGWKRFYGHALPKIGRRRGALPIVSD